MRQPAKTLRGICAESLHDAVGNEMSRLAYAIGTAVLAIALARAPATGSVELYAAGLAVTVATYAALTWALAVTEERLSLIPLETPDAP